MAQAARRPVVERQRLGVHPQRRLVQLGFSISIHRSRRRQDFEYRPAMALRYNFNGKRRTFYLPPWEERMVDLLLYRLLNRNLQRWFSDNSYAYRNHTYGLDHCQARIACLLRSTSARFT
jgi:hypothetical protein